MDAHCDVHVHKHSFLLYEKKKIMRVMQLACARLLLQTCIPAHLLQAAKQLSCYTA